MNGRTEGESSMRILTGGERPSVWGPQTAREARTTTRRLVVTLAAAVLAQALGGCFGPPQIGADRETFKTVDALYTAVGLREPKLVDQCDEKLKGLRAAGKLPDDASRSLEAIIAQAKSGSWETALTDLSGFMEGQRR
jgi:hypothetical protein